MATQVHAHGLGEAYKRKEDARFIRGQGNYVDDVQLPGMLYGDIVRSPYGHALIKNIDISEAMKVPGVVAVITGKDLDAAGLAWMPTLSADTEAVLALDRVHYQMQEVAFVVATSRYAAADGAAAVEVDYEPLPVVVDPKRRSNPMRHCCVLIRRIDRRPTRFITGKQVIARQPMQPLPKPKQTAWSSSKRCTSRVFIPRQLRPAAAWPTSIKRQENSRSG